MKINPNKLYIVYEPHVDSDIFDGSATTLEELFKMIHGGLTTDMIHGIYTKKSEAEKAADRIFGLHESEASRFQKFTQELAELSTKYSIAIHSEGGVYFFDEPLTITYLDDHTSGNLEARYDEREFDKDF